MANEETEGQQQRPAGYITIPMMVLNGWVGQDERYLKWWMWLRREAAWADREVCYNRQTVYLQMRQVLVTVNSLVKTWLGRFGGKARGKVGGKLRGKS